MDESMEIKIANMVKWMTTHEEELAKIIDMDIELTDQDCFNLVTQLERDGQYELILIFLYAGRMIDPIANISRNFWRRLAAEGWQTIGTASAIGQLKETIRDQMQ